MAFPAPAFLRCFLRVAETSLSIVIRSFFWCNSIEMMHFYGVSRACPGPKFLRCLLHLAETSLFIVIRLFFYPNPYRMMHFYGVSWARSGPWFLRCFLCVAETSLFIVLWFDQNRPFDRGSAFWWCPESHEASQNTCFRAPRATWLVFGGARVL